MDYTSEEIASRLSGGCGKVLVFDRIGSTNDHIKKNIDLLPDKTIVCAKTQSAGRGRRGRSFISDEGGAFFSILFKSCALPDNAPSVTACAAVCVAESIADLTGLDPKIKWVNDLLIDGKKICGILCEAVTSPDGLLKGLICGIGINLFPPPGGFDDSIKYIAGAINEYTTPPDAAVLISDIANRLFSFAPHFEYAGFIDVYRARSCVVGKEIEVLSPDCARTAYADSIGDDASLKVLFENGETKVLNSGEISIKIREK